MASIGTILVFVLVCGGVPDNPMAPPWDFKAFQDTSRAMGAYTEDYNLLWADAWAAFGDAAGADGVDGYMIIGKSGSYRYCRDI
jgi:hypothetical protein